MNLCPKCVRSSWPFVLVLAIASVAGFATWLTLGLSVEDPVQRIAAGAVAFLAVGATLLHYVLSCLRRHCRHGDQRPPRPGPVA